VAKSGHHFRLDSSLASFVDVPTARWGPQPNHGDPHFFRTGDITFNVPTMSTLGGTKPERYLNVRFDPKIAMSLPKICEPDGDGRSSLRAKR
jgi:hypothetical protein